MSRFADVFEFLGIERFAIEKRNTGALWRGVVFFFFGCIDSDFCVGFHVFGIGLCRGNRISFPSYNKWVVRFLRARVFLMASLGRTRDGIRTRLVASSVPSRML